jgi:hypothetical protein
MSCNPFTMLRSRIGKVCLLCRHHTFREEQVVALHNMAGQSKGLYLLP